MSIPQPPTPPGGDLPWLLVPLGAIGGAVLSLLGQRAQAARSQQSAKDVAIITTETQRITARIAAEGVVEAAELSAMSTLVATLARRVSEQETRGDALEREVAECHEERQQEQVQLVDLTRRLEHCETQHEDTKRDLAAATLDREEMRSDLDRIHTWIDRGPSE